MTAFIDTARALLREVLPRLFDLDWRHHGLGMLQGEITHEVRLHIWHPVLRTLQAPYRDVHDHRFDLRSAVLLGEITDCIYSIFEIKPPAEHEGTERLEAAEQAFSKLMQIAKVPCFEVRHAKIQTGSADDIRQIADVWIDPKRIEYRKHAAGTEYVIPKRSFHTTKVDRLAVTMIHRSNFDTRPARVLGAGGSGIVHDLDRARIAAVLEEARDALLEQLAPVECLRPRVSGT